VKVGTKLKNGTYTQINDYLVTVTIYNNTGGGITEKVQGGLAANATYVDPSTNTVLTPVNNLITIPSADITGGSCGAATINLSSAKTGSRNTGNVVIWNASGSNSTTAAGFAMTQGQSCTLQVIVRKPFTTTGQNAITSPWSELQSGPGTFGPTKSPYIGSLMVYVTP